ncbi:ESPR-type extended signal peptide-containing protein [Haemophilus haemolyticus]|uniref:ESPR-type extended signal peptide-containing protein n=1 Tax=Haemophilus haemolyticus TaxID=726 RepID=UPI000E0D1437|nr:ESPR-type extended signal peptide-containing protein [Haemophilus haemolyticus]
MNTIFKVIWNKSMQRQEVVSELARGAAKSNSTSRTNKIAKTHCASILATVITSILASNIAYAASNSNETVENKGFVHVNASGSSDDSAKNFGNFTAAAGATGANAITVGVKANSESEHSIAIGTESKVKKWSKNSLALGYKASVGNVGPTTHVDSNNAIAIGSEAEAIRDSAIAIGDKASAANYNAISIGKKIQNGSIGATAIGGAQRLVAIQRIPSL